MHGLPDQSHRQILHAKVPWLRTTWVAEPTWNFVKIDRPRFGGIWTRKGWFPWSKKGHDRSSGGGGDMGRRAVQTHDPLRHRGKCEEEFQRRLRAVHAVL